MITMCSRPMETENRSIFQQSARRPSSMFVTRFLKKGVIVHPRSSPMFFIEISGSNHDD